MIMIILNYDGVKEKPATLRAMTSLNRDEFERLCLTFGQAWEEETQFSQLDPSKGGRKPILKKHEDRLLFIFLYQNLSAPRSVSPSVWNESRTSPFFNLPTESDFMRNAEANGSSSGTNF